MRRPETGYRRRNIRDGVGFIWFTLLAMPFLMLSLAFSTDFARLVMIGHEMRNVADSGAIAAAWQIESGTVVIASERAVAAAEGTVCRYQGRVAGVSADQSRSAISGCAEPVTMDVEFTDENVDSVYEPGQGFRTAVVTVHYQVDRLIFPAYFGLGKSLGMLSATRSASVCVPGDRSNYTTGGFCNRLTN